MFEVIKYNPANQVNASKPVSVHGVSNFTAVMWYFIIKCGRSLLASEALRCATEPTIT